jgi:hypothetical protein
MDLNSTPKGAVALVCLAKGGFKIFLRRLQSLIEFNMPEICGDSVGGGLLVSYWLVTL